MTLELRRLFLLIGKIKKRNPTFFSDELSYLFYLQYNLSRDGTVRPGTDNGTGIIVRSNQNCIWIYS